MAPSAPAFQTVLQTKLYMPGRHRILVPRPRLVQRLDGGLAGRFTLVSAPAGYGKTTLMAQWLSQTEDGATAWLTLDRNDSDPVRFFTYLVASLQSVDEALASATRTLLTHTPTPSAEAVLTSLLNELASYAGRVLIALDDYHLIDSTIVHEAVAFLIEQMPPDLHLVIGTRADPPMPLARWRARGQMTEIRQADLRFAAAEADAFLQTYLPRRLTAAQTELLVRRTEGWIAGLQLAALSLRQRADLDRFVQAFSGDDRYILDYLSEEILHDLPATQQQFLLETSILHRLSTELCNAVTGRDDSRQVLSELEQANLFLVPLDNRRQWYQYHQLFADVLATRLRAAVGDDAVAALHRRAARWLAENQHHPEAIEHALAANDSMLAASLVEQAADRLMYQTGEVDSLARWLEALPDAYLTERPALILVQAWLHLWTTRPDAAEARLQAMPAHRLTGQMAGQAATLRAQTAALRGDAEAAITHAEEALSLLGPHELRLRGLALTARAGGFRQMGVVRRASAQFAEARALFQSADLLIPGLIALAEEGKLLAIQGDLQRSASIFQLGFRQAAKQGATNLPAEGALHIGMGELLRLQYDLAGARQQLRAGVELCHAWSGFADEMVAGLLSLAEVAQAMGDPGQARQHIQEAEALAHRFAIRHWQPLVALQTIRLLLAEGKIAQAADVAAPYRNGAIYSVLVQEQIAIVRARLALVQHDPAQTHAHLAEWQLPAEAEERMVPLIEMLILSALAHDQQGKTEQARAALGRALIAAAPGTIVQPFVAGGAPLFRLLKQALGQIEGSLHTFAGTLLAFDRAAPASPSPQPGVEPLVEALTQRQMEVLNLVAAGLSNQEIADALVVAVSTVKRHINHIYGKLGVSSRIQAVARARELELV